ITPNGMWSPLATMTTPFTARKARTAPHATASLTRPGGVRAAQTTRPHMASASTAAETANAQLPSNPTCHSVSNSESPGGRDRDGTASGAFRGDREGRREAAQLLLRALRLGDQRGQPDELRDD